jgi:Domain of unknown function (DUF4365)
LNFLTAATVAMTGMSLLSFQAQLKSISDVDRFVPKSSTGTLAYRLKAADLKHWEVAAQLIVVVVWDVTTKSGVWLTVPDIIKQLANGWREQRTVTVTFPRANGTDDDSLLRLRLLARIIHRA